VDARSDLYSLGVVLFELLTGAKPYAGNSAGSIGYAQRKGHIPLLPDDLYAWQGVIDRLLANDPQERYQDAAELIAAIDSGQRRQAEEATEHGVAEAARAPARSRRRAPGHRVGVIRWWVWPAGLTALALVAAFAWWAFDGAPPDNGTASLPAGVADQAGDASEADKVRRLLAIAAAHRAVGRLTEPPGANAYEAYRMVLEIAPQNQEARQGLSEIERLLADPTP
jgi:hypothetical protein